jgi:hypothetical protein
MRAATWLFVGLLGAACGDDDRRPSDDGGRVITVDGSAPRDSGGGPRDTGGGGECPPIMVPLPTGDICAAATLECVMMATTAAAQQMCVNMDPNPMCASCVTEEILACATNPPATCADEAGLVECCGDSMCAGLTGMALQTCIQTMCNAQGMAFVTCVNGAGCGFTPLCFMGGDGARPETGEGRFESRATEHHFEIVRALLERR